MLYIHIVIYRCKSNLAFPHVSCKNDCYCNVCVYVSDNTKIAIEERNLSSTLRFVVVDLIGMKYIRRSFYLKYICYSIFS